MLLAVRSFFLLEVCCEFFLTSTTRATSKIRENCSSKPMSLRPFCHQDVSLLLSESQAQQAWQLQGACRHRLASFEELHQLQRAFAPSENRDKIPNFLPILSSCQSRLVLHSQIPNLTPQVFLPVGLRHIQIDRSCLSQSLTSKQHVPWKNCKTRHAATTPAPWAKVLSPME